MAGVRIGGTARVFLPPGPPFYLSEGTTPPTDADQTNLWIVNSAGTPVRITPYTDPTCTSPPCASSLTTPMMNPAATLVAYTGTEPDPPNGMALWVIPADGTATYPITPLWSDGGDGSYANHSSWNAAGTEILFTYAGPDGGSYVGGTLGGRILQATYPGGVVTNLWTPAIQTPQREEGFRPRLSPDGTKIAFFVNIQAGGGGTLSRQGLWTMNPDGSGAAVIDNWSSAAANAGYLMSGTQSDWSHDSQWIVYVDRGNAGGGTFSVNKIKPDGTSKTVLKSGSAGTVKHHVGWGAWSDDDSYVVYTENTSGSAWSIRRINADGTGDAQLVSTADGPVGGTNFETCYRLRDRIYWVVQKNPGIISSCALDGSDLVSYFGPEDAQFFNGLGAFEWN